jgi:hypothetical protein
MSDTQSQPVRSAAPRGNTEQAQSRPERSPMATVAAIGTILTVISAVVGLVFLFAPGLKPAPPSPTRSAKLTSVEFVPSLSMRQMLDRTDQSTEGLTRKELAARVVFMRYRFETVGYKEQELPIKTELIRANRDQVHEQRPFTIVPQANEDSGTWFTWARLPRDRARYRLLLQIFEPNEVVPIDELQSEPFRGRP